ncbi:MAG: serine/threonine protein kinase [Candidatus Krumholzibacteriota bacterium]|nr:serine/threonine protein kinase [Candidatus Krumholzibacteriota bacterium]
MPTTFRVFEAKEKIGAGGMSTVYKGFHKTLGYPVAMKVLHPGLAGDASFISRFEREAKAASSLRTNNIASVIDFGIEDDVYFIIMEYIEGSDLGKIFELIQRDAGRSRAFPAEIALALIEEVAYGLKEAHKAGIIHRDIKPGNIMLSIGGEVKIADFGLARDAGDIARLSATDLTRPGTVVGTPSYMSPEQAAGKDLDARSDIFSLGVMAYQFLTGEKPFKGDTPTEVQERIINEEPPRITCDMCPLLTREIEDFIAKMLAKDPVKRFANMDSVIRSVKACMESIDSSGTIIKYRRDYMARFAEEPIAFSEELRHQNVSRHLKRGYHYKNMGESNIGDAIREFSYVIALDPANEKAFDALTELRKKAEESGLHKAVLEATLDPGKTMVLPSAGRRPAGEIEEAEAPPSEPALREPTLRAAAAPPAGEKVKPAAAPPRREAAPPRAGAGARRWLTLALGLVAAVVIIWGAIALLGRQRPPIMLSLTSEPPGAVVWLRQGRSGTFRETGLRTNCALTDLEAGEWEVKLVLAGFAEDTRTVDLAWGDTTRLAFPLVRHVAYGTLSVASEPPGAAVSVRPRGGGESWRRLEGVTPLAGVTLEAGEWELRLEREGSAPDARVVAIREGETTEQRIALEELPVLGSLTVRSEPAGAEVALSPPEIESYQRLGTTPLADETLPPGRWRLRLRKEGYEEATRTVTIVADRTETASFNLRRLEAAAPPPPPPTKGWIRLMAAPFADVYLDGEKVATEVRGVVVEAALGRRHTVELRHPPTFGLISLTGLEVAGGDTLDLGRQVFRWGSLAVSVNVPAAMLLDGASQGAEKRLLRLDRVGIGDHVLAISRPGFRVDRVTVLGAGAGRDLEPLNPGATPARYRIPVGDGAETRVRVELVQSG